MDNFLRVIKNGCATLIAAIALAFIGTASANAASYTYNVTGAGNLVGTITTTCNNCVLNASNVTAWNLTDSGVITVSSANAGSKFVVPSGATAMVAKPTEIDFNFGNRPAQFYEFTTAQHNAAPTAGFNNEIVFADGPVGCEACSSGTIASCASAGTCDISNPSMAASDGSGFNLIAKATATPNPGVAQSSIFGTTVTNTNQQIVDGQLDKWTLSGGQVYRNSMVTPSSGVILLVYYDGIVYQENSAHLWWGWLNSAWVAVNADPRAVSAASTTIPHETHLVDASHTVWTVSGGQIYANGYLKASSGVIQLIYAKGTIYQENIHNNWWVWSNGGWVALSAPPVIASSSGTTVPLATQLIDSQLKTWTLSGGKALVNGAVTPSASVVQLLYYNGSVYQENVNNNWWQWKNNAWAALAADPRVPALASAAGYKTLTFDSTVIGSSSGTWQASNLTGIPGCANAAVQNDDGSFTVRGYSINQQCFVALAIKSTTGANGWTGVTFKPGMYLKLVVSSVGTNPSGFGSDGIPGNVVGFGAKAIVHSDGGKKANGALLDQWPGQAPTYEHWQETDLFAESGPESLAIWYADFYGNATAGSLNLASSGGQGKLAGGKTWASQHTLEYVWVPATASVKGHIDGYVDGTKFTIDGDTTWTPYNPASPPQNYSDFWSIGDTQDTAFVAGTGTTNDLTVYSVQVWQTSTKGATKQ